MKEKQTIQVNVGTKHNNQFGVGEMDVELVRLHCEMLFDHSGVVSEPYNSNWIGDDGSEYSEKCIAAKITLSEPLTIEQIEARIEHLRNSVKQSAIAFTTSYLSNSYSDVYYGPVNPAAGYNFDPEEFHYVKPFRLSHAG